MPRELTTLRIPADGGRPCEVTTVRASAGAMSDTIGGGMLDESLVVSVGGHGCCFYADEHRDAKELPANGRAQALATLLAAHADEPPSGSARPGMSPGLRGDVLVTGLDRDGNDADLPRVVLSHAVAAGLLPEPTVLG